MQCLERGEFEIATCLSPRAHELFVLEVAVEIVAKTCHHHQYYCQVEFMPDRNEHLEVLAEFDAHPGEKVAPGK